MDLQKSSVTAAFLGWIIGIVSCALPMWMETILICSDRTLRKTLEGLWRMSLLEGNSEQAGCKLFDSTLPLSSGLLASRIFCVISIVLGVPGVLLAVMSSKHINCVEKTKTTVAMAAAVTLICAAVMMLVPVGWYVYTVVVSLKFPAPELGMKGLGKSFYLGCVSAGLLLTGGALKLPCKKPQQEILNFLGQCTIYMD
ncbi:claudin-4-like [Brachyhypopomus gauderio]|uniref:claudin-4-like n=1 Tax=Brachyhypopomus gauderio TaxID=698409 RepID=UPI0040420A21